MRLVLDDGGLWAVMMGHGRSHHLQCRGECAEWLRGLCQSRERKGRAVGVRKTLHTRIESLNLMTHPRWGVVRYLIISFAT